MQKNQPSEDKMQDMYFKLCIYATKSIYFDLIMNKMYNVKSSQKDVMGKTVKSMKNVKKMKKMQSL